MEPIEPFLSGQRLKIARLQDYIIDLIYDRIQPGALLYGGTAIWRCFGGLRFSEVIDIYLDLSAFKELIASLVKYDLRLIWTDPDLPSRVRIARDETDILLGSKPGFAENEIRPYLRIDGTVKIINVFSPTELMIRKIEAYNGRRYVRDIYDLFILTKWLERSDYVVRSKLSSFLNNLARPIDEEALPALLYAGPRNLNFDNMTEYLKRWLNEI